MADQLNERVQSVANRQREQRAEAEVDKTTEVDSIDSVICACVSFMFIGLVHSNSMESREHTGS